MANSITDSVTQNVVMNLGVAPMLSLNMAEIAMAHSIGLVMNNAAVAEKNSQVLQNAGVTQCCALMISIGAAGAAS